MLSVSMLENQQWLSLPIVNAKFTCYVKFRGNLLFININRQYSSDYLDNMNNGLVNEKIRGN